MNHVEKEREPSQRSHWIAYYPTVVGFDKDSNAQCEMAKTFSIGATRFPKLNDIAVICFMEKCRLRSYPFNSERKKTWVRIPAKSGIGFLAIRYTWQGLLIKAIDDQPAVNVGIAVIRKSK